MSKITIALGWSWHAYGNGFTRGRETKRVTSEREVFEHLGLPYLEPQHRRARLYFRASFRQPSPRISARRRFRGSLGMLIIRASSARSVGL
jgi:DNA polymerase beta thumb